MRQAGSIKSLSDLLCGLLLLLVLQSCGGGSSGSNEPLPPPLPLPPPPATGSRDQLTVDQLLGQAGPGVVHNDYFQPLGNLAPVSNALCGTIHVAETQMDTTHFDVDWRGGGHSLFPAFSLPVAIDGDWLIPLERDLILSGHGAGDGQSMWNIILNPGQVWQEVDDSAYSRAAFPFTLTDNYVGQARNGLATFVFNAAGVSSLAIQITQETAPVSEHDRTDFSALVAVTWDPTCPPEANALVAEFADERAARLAVRPWSDLPDAAATQATSRSGFADTDLSMVALLMDGELFVQDVDTRSGPHPWPEWMRHGVFSVTKTIGNGVAMFYLAQRYGDSIFDELITDYVPGLANHPGWQNVTFHHTLNMMTGTTGAEHGQLIGPFILARSAAAKIAAIEAFADAPAAPGAEFAYYSIHSFVLSYAMNNFVQAREGPGANFWEMVREDVLEPIGIPYLPISRSIEAAGAPGIPIMGWGSYPDVDAAAKIAQLLQDDGVFQGQQLLSLVKTREAMRRTSVPDYATGDSSKRYLHSVWTVRTNTGSCTVDVPLMSGAGGNHVMMLPSGLSVIRFMDADDYEVSQTVRAVEGYRSSCM
jgi:hypothetical protein